MNTIITQDMISYLPNFTEISWPSVETDLEKLLSKNLSEINQLMQQGGSWTWGNLIQPLLLMEEKLSRFWEPIAHLNAVANFEDLRRIYHICLPKLSRYHTAIMHNAAIFNAINEIAEGIEYQRLNPVQRKVVDDMIRDFKLAGAHLSEMHKQRLSALSQELAELTAAFEDHVLDSTKAFSKQIMVESQLKGLPDSALEAAKATAHQQGKEGFLFTLAYPSYSAVMRYAESRELRQEMYTAFVTRASDQGPFAKQWDNLPVMQEILKKRLELAHLLGFDDYANYALETRMVKTPDAVITFLEDLAKLSLPQAKQEYQQLSDFAKKELNIEQLEAWDILFASERLKKQLYSISEEMLRPYFPVFKVLSGLFDIVNCLFGITFKKLSKIDRWHDDVMCYGVYDKQGELRSYLYLDLYARENKQDGAWMNDFRSRCYLQDGDIQLPIGIIVCNLTPPLDKNPALLSHDEVITLFHEFGHALQHLLTKINYAPVSGINGIPWDAVELSSQLLENWAWQRESMDKIAAHYKTNEKLPEDLFAQMQQAKNFQSAMNMMRQLEFALFDIHLHLEFDPKIANQIQSIMEATRRNFSVFPTPQFNRFQNSFSHIFAGGYAAGYYSYKWAEVMAADAFSLFRERGLFDKQTAQEFQTYILEPGGSEDPAILFKAFRGRLPDVMALLRESGIAGS